MLHFRESPIELHLEMLHFRENPVEFCLDMPHSRESLIIVMFINMPHASFIQGESYTLYIEFSFCSRKIPAHTHSGKHYIEFSFCSRKIPTHTHSGKHYMQLCLCILHCKVLKPSLGLGMKHCMHV